MNTNDLQIDIKGDTFLGRRAVSNIITEALDDAGFTDIQIQNSQGDTVEREEVPSILDLVIAARPDLFDIPVTITTHPNVGEIDDDEEPEETESSETDSIVAMGEALSAED
jgi:hypothetical protein